MSRQLKFRAWDKISKRMIVDKQDFVPLIVTSKGVLKLNPRIKEDNYFFVEEDRFNLMQFTGLTDKKGNEIFEGDIVQHNCWNYPFEVIYNVDRARFSCKMKEDIHQQISGENLEIVGNIYENWDLLPHD